METHNYQKRLQKSLQISSKDTIKEKDTSKRSSKGKTNSEKQLSMKFIKTNSTLNKQKSQITQKNKQIISKKQILTTPKQKASINKNQTPIKSLDTRISKYSDKLRQPLEILLATLLDNKDLQFQFKILKESESIKKQITIPHFYWLIKQYEKIQNRAYTQEIRYYIVGTMWDQGYLKVGNLDEWKLNIRDQFIRDRQQKQQSGNNYLQVYNSEAQNITENSALNKNKVNGIQNTKIEQYLSPELMVTIQCIQQQYHKQVIAFQRLQQFLTKQENKSSEQNLPKQAQSSSDFANTIFELLDPLKIGYIFPEKLYKTFSLQQLESNTETSQNVSILLINKLCSNLHEFDNHNNTIETRPTSNPPQIIIQNLMQTLNRIKQKVNDNCHCSTYTAISYLLQKFFKIKNFVQQQNEKEDLEKIQNRNKKLMIVAEVEHIRNAASAIIEANKIKKTMLDIENLNEYETQKNKPIIEQNSSATFRHYTLNSQHDNDQKIVNTVSKDPAAQTFIDKFNLTSETILKDGEKDRKQQQTNTKKNWKNNSSDNFFEKKVISKKYESLDQSVLTKKPQSFLDRQRASRNISEQQQIKNYSVVPEVSNTLNTLEYKKDVRVYEKLLRQRIGVQLEVLALERMKNRINLYNILYDGN